MISSKTFIYYLDLYIKGDFWHEIHVVDALSRSFF